MEQNKLKLLLKLNMKPVAWSFILMLLLLLNKSELKAQSISSFSPTKGNIGSTVTITGTSFIGVTKVWFGTCPASTFTVVNATTITAVVPAMAYLGNIAVSNGTNLAISTRDFMVNNPQNVVFGGGSSGALNYVLKNGKLYAWGGGSFLPLKGDGAPGGVRNCLIEIPLKGTLKGKTISQLSVGSSHVLILASDGTVHSFGNNGNGQLGGGPLQNNASIPVEITNSGSLNGKTVIQVISGNLYSAALCSDGTVHTWGFDAQNQQGNGITLTGNIYSPADITNIGSTAGKTIVKINSGNSVNNTCMLASDGTLHAFGENANGCLGVGNITSKDSSVEVTMSGALAGKTIVRMFSGKGSALLLDNTGTVYACGSFYLTGGSGSSVPVKISTGTLNSANILSVTTNISDVTNSNSAYAFDTDGNIHVWGKNTSGELGINSAVVTATPTIISKTATSLNGKTLTNFITGPDRLYVLASDTTFHICGSALNGGLADGQTTINSLVTKLINFPIKPTIESSNLTFNTISGGTTTLNWTNGDGNKRIVIMKANIPLSSTAPSDGVVYTANTLFSSGGILDTTGHVVYNGTGNTVTVTGLSNSTTYHAAIFEYDTAFSPCNLNYYLMENPAKYSLNAATLATVTTTAASLINTTSATLGGNVIADGGVTVTDRGVVYATTVNPTTANTKVQIGNGNGVFSQNVTGLTSNTLYHVRAYAINSVGTSYGADSTFTTLAVIATAPTVITNGATLITSNSALLKGNVTSSGGASVTERGIVYSTTANPTIGSGTKVAIGFNVGTYGNNITGLNSATFYHFRAYAINSVDTSYGADSTFTTLAAIGIAPTVTTLSITSITSNSATLGGNVSDSGSAIVTERGIVYSTLINPTTSSAKVSMGSGLGTFSQNVTSLNSNTLYHVRAYAINSVGTSYGADSTFTTSLDLAIITTAAATLITSTSATLGGNVITSTSLVLDRGVVYATTPNPTIANTKVSIGAHLGTYSKEVTGLTPSTTYHVRAYAYNGGGTSYGADSTFTTLAAIGIAPTVTTASITAITSTSATIGGIAADSGTAAITERGVVYATTINPTTANTKVSIGTGLGVFSQMVTSLTPSTLYHVRAYAINSVGTSYGADSTFTTSVGISLPVVFTGSATAIANTSATLAGNVLADGGASVTERGIVLATTNNPTTVNTKITIGSGLGTFFQNVTTLVPNTTYHFRAYATNSVGTSYGVDSTFNTLATVQFNEKVTNAFSPDGDGINDGWVIENASQLDGHEITVYNIFGQVVFSQTGYANAWDGKKDGNPIPPGEYYYQIKGPKVNIKGALLIKTNQ